MKPCFDENGYPTAQTLTGIAEWPAGDFEGLIEYVVRVWRSSRYGLAELGEVRAGYRRIRLVTGGWRGNEDLIGALMDNDPFWLTCWESSRRGGEYVLEVPWSSERKEGE